MWVCTNTAVWLMIRAWLDPYSIALEHDPPVLRQTSLLLQRMNYLAIGHGHRHAAVQSTYDDSLVGVGY